MVWVKKTLALMHSPFEMTVFLDTDAYPCGSFLNVFELMRDRPSAIDIADAVAPVPFGGSYGDRLESFETGADGWSDFHERNTGLILYNASSPAVKYLLEQYHLLYVEQLSSREKRKRIWHDQPAFRQALWRARQGALSLKEHILSPTEHCRNCAPRNQYKCSWSSTAPLLLTASVRTNMEASLTASAADGADPDELLAEGSTCLVLHGKACGWRTVPPKAVPVSSRERAAGAA
mmetsp:Transcript_4149/g.14856  ORF Transcript_4149/g.14856 Transcript_4149/m.14856 type:complete len:234 (+) Transcript_4149:1049-1750(+)